MLEILILKEKHEGEEEARKLKPYIEQCDVYGVEGIGTFEEADQSEETWKKYLQISSRSEFVRELTRAYGNFHRRTIEYNVKRDEFMYLNQRARYVLEKTSPEDLAELNSVRSRAGYLQDLATRSILQGNMESFIEFASKALQENWLFIRMRDSQVAQNLISAEDHLKTKYPTLKDKKVLRLTMGIGALHTPEEHIRFPCKVVDLYTSPKFSTGDIDRHMKDEWFRTRNMRTEDILAFGAALLQGYGKMHPVTSKALEDYKRRHSAP